MGEAVGDAKKLKKRIVATVVIASLVVLIFIANSNRTEAPSFLAITQNSTPPEQPSPQKPTPKETTKVTPKKEEKENVVPGDLLQPQKLINTENTAMTSHKKISGKFHDEVAIRERFVRLKDNFFSLQKGHIYNLNLFDDENVIFEVTEKEQIPGSDADKYYVIGKVKNTERGSVKIVVHPNKVVAASVLIPNKNPYRVIFVGDGVHRISERRIAKRIIPPIYSNMTPPKR